MFFILSKILYFLISPFIWFCITFCGYLFLKKRKTGRILLIASISILLLFSNKFVATEVLRKWEMPTMPYSKLDSVYDYGIVMGGMSTYDTKFGRINFKSGIDRMLQALDLYKKQKIRKLIITGGSGSLLDDYEEARVIKEYFVMMGIPSEDMLVEFESRNTHENAVNTKKLLDGKNKNPKLLIFSSAFHMRRTLGCFAKTGLHPTPFVTDRIAGLRKFNPDHLLLPNVEALLIWETFFHELIGYITYDVIGYI